MKAYITRINGWGLRNRLHYMQNMVAEIAYQMGCLEMGIYRYNADGESSESLSSRLDGIIAGINRGDLVICQFPTGNGRKFEYELVNRLKVYGGRIAIYIHELETLAQEEKKHLVGETIGLYNLAEVLIVQTYAMRNWLLEHGIRRSMKFVVQEMWDYTVQEPVIHSSVFKKEIYFTDNEGFAGMNSWNYAVPLKLYNVSVNAGQNVQNLGERDPYQLFSELSEGGFGLVWYRDEYSRQYMEYSISFSLARYLAAGIPVIVPAGISHREMIEINHLGFVVNSLEEAVAAVEKMTEGEYQEYTKAVEQFAPALRSGYYVKRCLIETIQALYRKDAGRIPAPDRVYETEGNAFRSVSLTESYGGSLALSWDFQGEAEGFLIYDTAGILQGHIRDIYQHYLLLKGQEKEKGFLVKAYVETLKGKLILAESKPVYLEKKQYGEPKVSMIIPAYNAENYIARCIDTVLAQSLQDVEIIVVDDGSTDHTSEIIDWYADYYENVTVIHQKNSGVAAARNTGMKNSRGEYIGFVDNDDLIYPGMVERLYLSAKKNDCDIAVTSVYIVNDAEYVKSICYPVKEDVPIAVDDFFHIYNYGTELGVVVWNKLYRASLAKRFEMPAIPYDDVAWTTCILSYADKICYMDDHSYEWDRRVQESSQLDEWFSHSKQEMFEERKRTILFFLEEGNQDKMDLLKERARVFLNGWENVYHNEEYGKLRDEIEANY